MTDDTHDDPKGEYTRIILGPREGIEMLEKLRELDLDNTKPMPQVVAELSTVVAFMAMYAGIDEEDYDAIVKGGKLVACEMTKYVKDDERPDNDPDNDNAFPKPMGSA